MCTVLAADTSTSVNTVALCRGDGAAPHAVQVVAEATVECPRLHSERLIATVDWLLQEARLDLDAVDLLAIAIGPGSFTGLRIGAATWKGLAFGKRRPLVAVPTLDAMSRVLGCEGTLICPLLDARMQEVYAAAYHFVRGVRHKVLQERVSSVECLLDSVLGLADFEKSPICFLGDGVARYPDRIRERIPHATFAPAYASTPRASAVAAEALCMTAAGAHADPALAVPVYLRQSQAEVSRARAAGGEG